MSWPWSVRYFNSYTFSTHFKCFNCSICIDRSDGKHALPCCFCLETVSPGQLNKVPYKQGRWSKSFKQKIVWRCHRNIVHRYCKNKNSFSISWWSVWCRVLSNGSEGDIQRTWQLRQRNFFISWMSLFFVMVMHFYRRGLKCLYISWYLSSDVNS